MRSVIADETPNIGGGESGKTQEVQKQEWPYGKRGVMGD